MCGPSPCILLGAGASICLLGVARDCLCLCRTCLFGKLSFFQDDPLPLSLPLSLPLRLVNTCLFSPLLPCQYITRGTKASSEGDIRTVFHVNRPVLHDRIPLLFGYTAIHLWILFTVHTKTPYPVTTPYEVPCGVRCDTSEEHKTIPGPQGRCGSRIQTKLIFSL